MHKTATYERRLYDDYLAQYSTTFSPDHDWQKWPVILAKRKP